MAIFIFINNFSSTFPYQYYPGAVLYEKFHYNSWEDLKKPPQGRTIILVVIYWLNDKTVTWQWLLQFIQRKILWTGLDPVRFYGVNRQFSNPIVSNFISKLWLTVMGRIILKLFRLVSKTCYVSLRTCMTTSNWINCSFLPGSYPWYLRSLQ